MKAHLQTAFIGRLSVPPAKRFLINYFVRLLGISGWIGGLGCLLFGLGLPLVSIASEEEAHGESAVLAGTVPLPPAPSPEVMARRYEIISRGGVLSTIPPIGVVWVEADHLNAPEEPGLRRVVQRDFTFHPSLMVVPVGTRIEFPNEDDEYHNVFSYSPAERFDLGRYLPEERPIPSHTFDNAGMVTLRCDIHEHMRAIILVVATPFHTETDTEGRFRLEGLPPGRYTVKAWIDSRTTLEEVVDLQPGEVRTLDISVTE